jgi:ectoine hydroxylase-related dioxygenase (phytanoyl-CoA dioxygenase family)
VRAILFDKTPASNWYVTWHQDLSIPVKERFECEGYGPWSVKDDVVHVQPPAAILEKMVSLRIHLDPCSEKNGPIKFIAGSHLSGILETPEIERWRNEHEAVVCPTERCDIIAMRPLILHSSSSAESPEHRRVLHIEYAAGQLPAGMQWAEA